MKTEHFQQFAQENLFGRHAFQLRDLGAKRIAQIRGVAGEQIHLGSYRLFRAGRWPERIFVEVHFDGRVGGPRRRGAFQARNEAQPRHCAQPVSTI